MRKFQNLERKHTEIFDNPHIKEGDKEAITSEMGELKSHWFVFTTNMSGKKER